MIILSDKEAARAIKHLIPLRDAMFDSTDVVESPEDYREAVYLELLIAGIEEWLETNAAQAREASA